MWYKVNSSKLISTMFETAIAIHLTRRFKIALLQEAHNYDNILLWAACCIAFLWVPEMKQVYCPIYERLRPISTPFL